jgi:hypothetical protein
LLVAVSVLQILKGAVSRELLVFLNSLFYGFPKVKKTPSSLGAY